MHKLTPNPSFFSILFLLVLIISIPIAANANVRQRVLAETEKKTKSIYSIHIDLELSELYVFKEGKMIKSYKCSGGTESTPSPIGTWTIISKANWGEGFGGYWMGLNCPWGLFGIHGTTKPESIGHPASHGCIRLLSHDAAELYSLVPHGTKVTITNGPYGPFGKKFRSIKPGMYGSDVLEIQKYLKKEGYFSGYCNGIYDGADFQNAVYKYQKKKGFKISNVITPALIKSMGFKLIE